MDHMHYRSDESIKLHLYMSRFSVFYPPFQFFEAGFIYDVFQLTCLLGCNVRWHVGFAKLLHKKPVLFAAR